MKNMTGKDKALEFAEGVLADITKASKVSLQLKHDDASNYLVQKLDDSCKQVQIAYLLLTTVANTEPTDDERLKQLMKDLNALLSDVKPTYERCLVMLAGLKTKKRKRGEDSFSEA